MKASGHFKQKLTNMRKVFLAIGFLVGSIAAMAQNDPEAKTILDAVSAKFKSFSSVTAGFSYKIENSAGKVQSSKTGTVIMKGTKYKVKFGNQEIFCDGKTVWSYDGDKEVTISNLDPNSNSLTPQKLFTNFYDNDFLYILNGEKKIGNKTIQEIEMTPTDKNKPFHKIYLQVDKNAKTIYSTKVLENSGNRYTYTVSTMKTNTPVADATFTWDKSKHPGVEEVDLR